MCASGGLHLERNALLQKVVQVFKALCTVSCRQAVAIDATQELLKRLTKVSVSHGGSGCCGVWLKVWFGLLSSAPNFRSADAELHTTSSCDRKKQLQSTHVAAAMGSTLSKEDQEKARDALYDAVTLGDIDGVKSVLKVAGDSGAINQVCRASQMRLRHG